MSFVQKVDTNVKNLGRQTLGPKTLVVGNCASGKTGVVQALEIALTGTASDVAGRAVVKDAALLASLAPSMPLTAVADFDDGARAETSIGPNGKDGFSKKSFFPPAYGKADEVLPLRAIREALTGSPEKAQRFLLQAALNHISEGDVLSLFGGEDSNQAKMFAAASQGAPSTDIVDRLLVARANGRERARTAKVEADGALKAIEAIGAGQVLPSEAEIEKQKAVVADLRGRASATQARIDQASASRPDVSALYQRREELLAIIARANEEAPQLKARYAQIAPPGEMDAKRASKEPLLRSAADLHGRHAQGNTDICLVCESHVGAQTLVAKAAGFRQAMDAWFAQGAARTQELTERASIEQRFAELAAGVKHTQGFLETVDREIAKWSNVGLPDTSEDERALGILREALGSAETYLGQLQGAYGSWESIRRAQEQEKTLRQTAALWGQFEAQCDVVIEQLVNANLAGFVARVQRYLPATVTFDIELSPFRFGFRKDGQLHVALSGAEWVQTLCAIGAALGENTPYSLLIPEERAFDPFTLAQMMEALSDARAQVVLTSTVFPAHVPNGWTVIQLGDLATSKGDAPAAQAPVSDKPKRLGKKEKETLLALGWTESQIKLMTPITREHILESSVPSDGKSILPDGKLFVIGMGSVSYAGALS